MRIIAGSARGRRLSSIKGEQTRPTADRVREALFSILFSRLGSLEDKTVLDMFAGSGALTIEALSRGASHGWLVEKSPLALQTLQNNLICCSFLDHAEVIRGDLWKVISRVKSAAPFDLIFIDPPYNRGLALKALEVVANTGLLAAEGITTAETDAAEKLPDRLDSLVRIEQRRYGSTTLHFYQTALEES